MGILNFMRKKKLVTLGVAMVLGTMVLSGCGGKDTKTKAASDTLYIGMSNPPEFFNPLVNPGVAGKFAIRFMYDSLLGMPEPNHFTPALADSFESKDNQNFVIKLNQYINALISILIHYTMRNKSVNIKDVIFSIDSSYDFYVQQIENIEPNVDDLKNLIAPRYLFL